MTYQFKSEVTAGDFWKLTMSRTYRSVAGVCNMVFTVAMILFTAKFFRTSGDLMQMLMLFGCLLFPVIQPIAIYLKAKGQAKTMPKDVELSFDDAGLHVTVGKEKESIGWLEQLTTKKVYSGGKRAWHDDRFFRCKTWIYAYKPYFGSTERTIFCICKRKDRRDELVYAGWQIRQLNGERSRMG